MLRLHTVEDQLEKESFPEIPPRAEYHLTPFGQRLLNILDQVEELQQQRERVDT